MLRWIRSLYIALFLYRHRKEVKKPGPQTVHVLIPAHNEESSIASTLQSLKAQTFPIAHILVVLDRCTDATSDIAREHGAEVIETYGNTHLKAGALNQGLEHLLKTAGDEDFVLVMDADSILVPGFLESAIAELQTDPRAGSVCATFAGEPERKGIIHAFQRNEYARFARSIARRKARAQVLSGVATVFPVSLLTKIAEARKSGKLPAAPGIYEVTAATEDIEMTFAVRHLGYRPLAPKACLAYTDTMATWQALARQRIRWQRGMLDALRLYGLNRQTLPYALRLGAMYIASLAPFLYLALVILTYLFVHGVSYEPVWLCALPLFCFDRVWTVRRQGLKEALVAVLLIPEWLYDNYRAVVYWIALAQWVRRTERVWIPT